MVLVMGCQFVFFLVLKWTFYRHRYHKTKSGSDETDPSDMDDGMDDEVNASYDDAPGSARW